MVVPNTTLLSTSENNMMYSGLCPRHPFSPLFHPFHPFLLLSLPVIQHAAPAPAHAAAAAAAAAAVAPTATSAAFTTPVRWIGEGGRRNPPTPNNASVPAT